MPLNFNEHILAPECIDQKLRAIRGVLGSARASRAVSGALAGNFFNVENVTGVRCTFGEASNVAREGACAPRSKERDQSFRKLRQLIPPHGALPFLAPQMRLSEQFAQIFVACSVFYEHLR